MKNIKIKSVLISVFNKEGLDELCRFFFQNQIDIFSTGGTEKYIKSLNIPVKSVESVTGYPSILGGRVKTLHPKIFGSLLSRNNSVEDQDDIKKYELPKIDMVVVDLYPFSETVRLSNEDNEIIEKIDIGGVSLIRAGAKNFSDIIVVSRKEQYSLVLDYLKENNFSSQLDFRQKLAFEAFNLISQYDKDIDVYFGLKCGVYTNLRYGENPHQKAVFKGNLDHIFKKLNGKNLSYNNLLDVDSAIKLISEFHDPTFAIIKHNNACGIASAKDSLSSYLLAFQADPLSAFGGVLISNTKIDYKTSIEIDKLFFEILIAPEFDQKALEVLKSKKNRILLLQKKINIQNSSYRNILNGVIQQDYDNIENISKNWKLVTNINASGTQIEDLEFANKIVKHSKSNAIVLVKNKQMISSGIGQTSRIDALKFAIEKAKQFKFDVKGASMASDAFFPFPDCVEIASSVGISTIVQPGGSVKDELSIKACNDQKISMFFTGLRHFYH
tara:strand:+ start:1725 stop:3221 length:1497 start_codon:yes stop_codon:yes gene_type:complete